MKISSKLIDKYLNGACTREERDFVHEWYNSFETEDEPLLYLSESQQQELNQRMMDGINNNIHSLEGKTQKKSAYFRYSTIGIAATMLLIFGLFLLRTKHPDTQNKISLLETADQLVVNSSSTISKRQLLPDGTVIWLKPHSKISYAKHFTGQKFREISLNGEAFFDVKRDTLHPFVIKTGNINTKVLGTSFNIKAYDNSNKAEVSVITGKVLVYLNKVINKKSKAELYLLPNEKAVYLKTTSDLCKEKDFTLKMWRKNNFTFDDTPVPEVMRILEQHFAIKVKIMSPEINKYTLKADFNNQNLPNILELLSKSMDINYQISGNQIQISKNQLE